MRLRRLIWGSALAVSLAVPAVADAAGYGRRDAESRFVPGEALVRYSAGTDAGERRELRSAAGVDFERSLLMPRTQVVSFQGPVGEAIEVVGRRAFAIGRVGRASVRIKLKKAALKRLRRKRTLRLASRAVIRNSAGLRASTSGTIRLTVRRR